MIRKVCFMCGPQSVAWFTAGPKFEMLKEWIAGKQKTEKEFKDFYQSENQFSKLDICEYKSEYGCTIEGCGWDPRQTREWPAEQLALEETTAGIRKYKQLQGWEETEETASRVSRNRRKQLQGWEETEEICFK